MSIKNLAKTASFAGALLRRNVVPGDLPYKAILVTTWGCQARCVMCDIWKRRPHDELTLDEYVKLFKANSHFRWLTLTGGEPFLRDDLVDIAKAAIEHCPGLNCLNMPTNSLDPPRILAAIEEVLKTNVPQFVLGISLDGPPEVHDRVRGLPGTWDKAMQVLLGCKELQKKYPNFLVMMEHCLLPPAYGRFEEMVKAVQASCPDVTAKDFLVATANVSEHYYGNTAAAASIKTAVDKSEAQEALRHIIVTRAQAASLDPRYIFPQVYLNMAVPFVETNKPPMKCRATRSTVFIDPNGAVYPCNAWSKVLGNVREHDYSLRKIFDTQDMRQIRKDIDEFKCGGCWTPCEASQSLAENVIRPSMIAEVAKTFIKPKGPSGHIGPEAELEPNPSA